MRSTFQIPNNKYSEDPTYLSHSVITNTIKPAILSSAPAGRHRLRYTLPIRRVYMKVLLLMLAMTATSFAETYRFEPTEFYNTFSGAHKPVLRIKPGDLVVTFTIDARGIDSAGVQRGQKSNPETGPFYIEGAEPGDTLVVHLLRLETNRATGFSASLLAPYTADPGFLRQDALREQKTMTWH